jgi:hypothetical protein
MIQIEMSGSFTRKSFETSAENGGHVCAIKRGIEFLSAQLGPAVVVDASLTKDGVIPSKAPLGCDEVLKIKEDRS